MKQRFRSKKQYIEWRGNKIALGANDDERILDSIETFIYRTNKEVIHKKEEISI